MSTSDLTPPPDHAGPADRWTRPGAHQQVVHECTDPTGDPGTSTRAVLGFLRERDLLTGPVSRVAERDCTAAVEAVLRDSDRDAVHDVPWAALYVLACHRLLQPADEHEAVMWFEWDQAAGQVSRPLFRFFDPVAA